VKAWVGAGVFSNTVASSFETPRETRGSQDEVFPDLRGEEGGNAARLEAQGRNLRS